MTRSPHPADAAISMAVEAAQEGRHEAAVRHFHRALAEIPVVSPDRSSVLIALAGELESLGRFDDAHDALADAVRSAADKDLARRAQYMLGLNDWKRGRFRESAAQWESVISGGQKGSPSVMVDALNSLALLRRDEGRLKEALDLLATAESVALGSVDLARAGDAVADAGRIHARLGAPKAAADAFRRAHAIYVSAGEKKSATAIITERKRLGLPA